MYNVHECAQECAGVCMGVRGAFVRLGLGLPNWNGKAI